MVNMGVSSKQKATARQMFQRSATLAGFFWSGAGRLVYPRIKGSAVVVPAVDPNLSIHDGDDEHNKSDRKKSNGSGGDGGSGGGKHQLLDGLMETLPAIQTDWNMEDRKNWLQAAATIFNLIYKSTDKSTLTIEVKDATK
jgi:hypothetical protein